MPPTEAPAKPGTETDDELARKREEAAAGNGDGGSGPVDPPAGDPPADPDAKAHSNDGSGDLEGEGDGERPENTGLQVEADGQLSLKVGGKKPDKSTFKLGGKKINIPKGQYDKGDTVNLLVKVRCTEVHLIDHIDGETQEITGAERRHIFKVQGVEKV